MQPFRIYLTFSDPPRFLDLHYCWPVKVHSLAALYQYYDMYLCLKSYRICSKYYTCMYFIFVLIKTLKNLACAQGEYPDQKKEEILKYQVHRVSQLQQINIQTKTLSILQFCILITYLKVRKFQNEYRIYYTSYYNPRFVYFLHTF